MFEHLAPMTWMSFGYITSFPCPMDKLASSASDSQRRLSASPILVSISVFSAPEKNGIRIVFQRSPMFGSVVSINTLFPSCC